MDAERDREVLGGGFEGQTVLVTGGSGFIGTSLVKFLLERGARVCNLDIRPPLDPSQRDYWSRCDIMDREALEKRVRRFGPRIVVHLAARTECVEDTTVEEGYAVNTTGTRNVLEAVGAAGTVDRLIVTSSQYVCGPGHRPAHERDYGPHTVYGASKAESEEVTRELDPDCTWTIIRPVNIWGPYHERYRREAWRMIEKGLYMHPGRSPVVRTYGYVGNVVWQMARILEAPPERVHGQVFYLGDAPVDIYSWVDAFSRKLRGRKARVVPRSLVRLIALAGDTLAVAGWKAPLTTSRYRSMTSDYRTPMTRTFEAFGDPPYSLAQGVEETVAWLRSERLAGAGDRPVEGGK